MSGWTIVILIAGIVLIIMLVGFVYAFGIARKDGQPADEDETKISFAAQHAAKELVSLNAQNRSLLCRVSRGMTGIRVEISSSGNPPVNYDREVQLGTKSEDEQRRLCGQMAQSIAYFTNNQFIPMQEYSDSYRLEKNLYYVPPQTPTPGGIV